MRTWHDYLLALLSFLTLVSIGIPVFREGFTWNVLAVIVLTVLVAFVFAILVIRGLRVR